MEMVTEPEINYLLFCFSEKDTQCPMKAGRRIVLCCFVSLLIEVLKTEREASWKTPKHCRSYRSTDIGVERRRA